MLSVCLLELLCPHNLSDLIMQSCPLYKWGNAELDATPKRSQEGAREGTLLPGLLDARRQVGRNAMVEGGGHAAEPWAPDFCH